MMHTFFLRIAAIACALLASIACSERHAPAPVPATSRNAESPWNLAGPPPHLVAHYLAWYTTDDDPAHAWDHWKWQHPKATRDPARTLPGNRRDIASAVYPLIGPYDSASREVMRYHLATARAAGVQAILVLWYGPTGPIDRLITPLLDEADALDMRLGLCYEEKVNWPPYRQPADRDAIVLSATADLGYALEKYAPHRAFLRRNGLPFFCQFNYWGAGELGPNSLTPDEWTEVFAHLPSKIVYARQNLDPIYHPPIQGAFIWWTEDDEWLSRFGRSAQESIAAGRLDFYMTMVAPGFDDSGVWGWGAGPRRSKEYGLPIVRKTLSAATAGKPELIQLVTWNDFNEATSLEPTTEYGFAFLDAIATQWAHTRGRSPDLEALRAAYRTFTQQCSAKERSLLPLVDAKSLAPHGEGPR